MSLLLLILGTGFGLSAVSPWSTEGISAATFGFTTIAWLSFTQIAASGMGGYLAGRLRTKWTAVHADEVFFRDTAHGFLTWAVAALVTAAVLTSVAGSIVSGGVRAGAAMTGGAASAVGTVAGATDSDQVSSSIEYFVDSLFRRDLDIEAQGPTPQTGVSNGSAEVPAETGRIESPPRAVQRVRALASEVSEIPTGEVIRIFARAMQTGTLPNEDERYVGQLIAQHTDLSQQDAEQRVSQGFEELQTTLNEVETTAREVADEAREAAAYGSLWIFVTLLMGAFSASLMAVFGGRQRDA
ncbi:MAG: hypothetical protein ABR578_05175 [Chromatocurvus sp.]